MKQAQLLVSNTSGRGPAFVVPEDIESRFLVITGNGLLYLCYHEYKESILGKQLSCTKQYEQSLEVIKALRYVIFLNSDFHAGCFHMLGPIYTVFFGGLIQPIQCALGIKHIDRKKVEKCYQQASGLVQQIAKSCS